MAIRLFFYIAEIWRDVIKNTSKADYEKKEFKLPAILPVVIYNGKEKWTATKTLGEQINMKELLKDSSTGSGLVPKKCKFIIKKQKAITIFIAFCLTIVYKEITWL